ncbi:hypothetical protein [Cupriavidus oxalaticus]|uniref:hypothetical protein n=1 Tax=Cupriavidus oxalaticus TaxID=96344 RepID=UPI003F73E116
MKFDETWAGTKIPASQLAYRLRDEAGNVLAEGITGEKRRDEVVARPGAGWPGFFDKRGKAA